MKNLKLLKKKIQQAGLEIEVENDQFIEPLIHCNGCTPGPGFCNGSEKRKKPEEKKNIFVNEMVHK
jgi:hypothetical protein